jgi:hypothetical protein
LSTKRPSGWTLARDLAQARLHEQLATGKVNASQLATVAGIAERNVRYGELLRQREARRAAEQAVEPEERDEIYEAANALPEERQRWLGDALRHELLRRDIRGRDGNTVEVEAHIEEVDLLAYIQGVGAWTDDEFATERTVLDAAMAGLSTVEHPVIPPRPQPTAPLPAEPPQEPSKPLTAVVEVDITSQPDTWEPVHREEW